MACLKWVYDEEVDVLLECISPSESLQEIRKSIGMKISMRRVAAKDAALWELMEICMNSKSSDPRDKIYALLALAHDVPKEGFKVDYSRSIFKVQVDFVWFYQCKKNSRPEFISNLCQLVDTMLGDCDLIEEDWPRPERVIKTQPGKVSFEMRHRLLTHKKRRLDLLKEQKMDEMKWKEARFSLRDPERFWDKNYWNRWRQDHDRGQRVTSQLDLVIASTDGYKASQKFCVLFGVATKKGSIGSELSHRRLKSHIKHCFI